MPLPVAPTDRSRNRRKGVWATCRSLLHSTTVEKSSPQAGLERPPIHHFRTLITRPPRCLHWSPCCDKHLSILYAPLQRSNASSTLSLPSDVLHHLYYLSSKTSSLVPSLLILYWCWVLVYEYSSFLIQLSLLSSFYWSSVSSPIQLYSEDFPVSVTCTVSSVKPTWYG